MVKRSHDMPSDDPSQSSAGEGIDIDALMETFGIEERQAWIKAQIDEVVRDHMSGVINSQEYTRRIEALEFAAASNKADHENAVAQVNKTPRSIGQRVTRFLFH